jgi:hypothetical protein
MKKLIITFLIATVVIGSTFAQSDSKDILINGGVSKSEYSFTLLYDKEYLQDGSIIGDTFNINIISDTKPFIVQRTGGNLNKDLGVSISIVASPFTGLFDGEANYNTGIIPKVKAIEEGYSYTSIEYDNQNESGEISLLIKAGKNKDIEDIAAFYFTINGDETIPAGNYQSTISITYTYNQ